MKLCFNDLFSRFNHTILLLHCFCFYLHDHGPTQGASPQPMKNKLKSLKFTKSIDEIFGQDLCEYDDEGWGEDGGEHDGEGRVEDDCGGNNGG